MIEYLQKLLQENPLFQGGFVLAILGVLSVYARKIPNTIIEFLKKKLMYSITIDDRDDLYVWMILWLEVNYPKGKTKKLVAVSSLVKRSPNENSDTDSTPNKNINSIIYKPDSSGFFIKYQGTIFYMYINREKMTGTAEAIFLNFHESITIKFFSKKGRMIVTNLLTEAKENAKQKEDENYIQVYINVYNRWSKLKKIEKRKLDTVFYNNNIKENIINDIDKFLNNEKWYAERGIRHSRGYLLEGLPGNGKTSLIIAIASYLNYSVYFINLSGSDMNDQDLISLFSQLPENSIIVFEEFDTIFDKNRNVKTKDSKLTFSALLNVIDGLASGTQKLTFFTSNHSSKLDKALLRPGRIDEIYHFTNASKGQIFEMFENFYGEISLEVRDLLYLAIKGIDCSMAQLQDIFLKNKDDKYNAIKCLKGLKLVKEQKD